MIRLLDVLLGDRIERLEAQCARLTVELSRQRERCRRLLAENGRLRRLLADHNLDADNGRAWPDEDLLSRAFGHPK